MLPWRFLLSATGPVPPRRTNGPTESEEEEEEEDDDGDDDDDDDGKWEACGNSGHRRGMEHLWELAIRPRERRIAV